MTGGIAENRKKMLFAERVNKYMKNPAVVKSILYEVIRDKIGPYASDQWFDPVYLATPSRKRPSFLEAFKKKWVKMLDSDDFNTIIQRYGFDTKSDAHQLGLAFEQYMRPFLEMAENDTVREAAEKAKVARFKKVIGGSLMAQMIQRHPKKFETVEEMITLIKELNDELGISHRVQPAESYNIAAMYREDHKENNGGNQNSKKNGGNGNNGGNNGGKNGGQANKNKGGNENGKANNGQPENSQEKVKSEKKPYFELRKQNENQGGGGSNQQPTQPSQGQDNQQRSRQGPKSKSEGREVDDSEMICFHCDQKGHRGKNCEAFKKLERKKFNKKVCVKCDKRGHFAKYCTEQTEFPVSDGTEHRQANPEPAQAQAEN